MSILAIVCVLLLMAAGVSATVTTLAIQDQVEDALDLPFEERPSWTPWNRPFDRGRRWKEYLRSTERCISGVG